MNRFPSNVEVIYKKDLDVQNRMLDVAIGENDEYESEEGDINI